jgi:hypothetical protein
MNDHNSIPEGDDTLGEKINLLHRVGFIKILLFIDYIHLYLHGTVRSVG